MSMTKEVRVEEYDFSYAASISPQQKKSIHVVHESYAQFLEKSLTSFLTHDVSITLEQEEEVVFSNYLEQLSIPCAIGTFDMTPLNGYGIIEVNSPLMYAMVNRMLGGALAVPKQARPFTEVEQAVIQKVLAILLQDLQKAWSLFLHISFQLKELHVNPTFVQSIPKREMCLVSTFKIKVGEATGLMTLCLPHSNLEFVASKMVGRNEGGYVKYSEETFKLHCSNFFNVEVSLEAVLGSLELSAMDLLALSQGDILDLGCKTTDPIHLNVAGKKKFHCKPGLTGKHKAVLIEEEL